MSRKEVAVSSPGSRYRLEQAADGSTVGVRWLRHNTLDHGELHGYLRLLAKVQSQHLAKHRDIIERDGKLYLVTEPLGSRRLSDELYAMPPARFVEVIDGVLEAIVQMHEVGAWHGRLRPQVIAMLDRGPVIGELDFVISIAREPFDAKFTAYLPPERTANKLDDTCAASDVYAIAAIAWEYIMGRPVLRSRTWNQMFELIYNEPIARLDVAGLAPELVDTIARALSKSFAERPSARELRNALHLAPLVRAPRIEGAILFDAIARDPGDRATRTVYADWLEQNGFANEARCVRADDDLPSLVETDPIWRRTISRARIANACHPRWDQLTPTINDFVRVCATCNTIVQYRYTPPDDEEMDSSIYTFANDIGWS